MMDFINGMDTGDWIACGIGLGLAILTTYFKRGPYAGANRGVKQGPSILLFLLLLVLCFPIAIIYLIWPRRRLQGGRAYLSRGELKSLERIEAMELRAKLGQWQR